MPKRPRSHRLSDESRRVFEEVIPDNWVFRPEYPDYGIDGQVEIFDDTDDSTGYRFYVQLKATDNPDPKAAESTVLRRDTGAYYGTLDLPVLIVLYHAASKTLCARWFQEFDPYYDRERQDTIVFRFADRHGWTEATPRLLLRDLVRRRDLRSGTLSAPLLVALEIDATAPPPRLREELEVALDALRGTAALTEDGDQALATISVLDDRIIARLGAEFGTTLHVEAHSTDARVLAADSLVLLSIALGSAHQYAIAARIALTAAVASSIIERDEVFSRLTRTLARGRQVADALELSEKLVSRFGATWAAEALRMPALAARQLSTGEQVLYDRYLARRVEIAESGSDRQQTAIAHYNRGNLFRGTGRHREAVREFALAARMDPAYWERDYFCSELAGVFFLLGRYRCAAHLYERSLTNGAGAEVKPLLADALMFAGRYQEAKAQFSEYLATTTEIAAEWRLKDWALEQILALGISTQIRATSHALALAGDLTGPAKGANKLESALGVDALCGLARFNKGAGALADGDRRAAVEYYLLAALCQSWDLEAWRNAYALATEHEEDRQLAPWILIAAYELHHERFLETLVAAMQAPIHQTSDHVRSLKRLLDELPGRKESIEMRLLGPGSEYISFDIASGKVRHGGRRESA